jgi:type I restriction enzyme R subunit
MLWLALKLRRDAVHDNPTLVIVTDRKDLDEQITKTFRACGFPNPERAESVRDLRALLSGPTGKTILTTVQKFQELAGAGRRGTRRKAQARGRSFPSSRTSHQRLRPHRRGPPHPVRRPRRQPPQGPAERRLLRLHRHADRQEGPQHAHHLRQYIDTYTIEQAVVDGATVPIFYEGRLAELRIVGNNLDAVFDRVFADRSREEREAIKKKYAREAAIAGAPRRIETIALDLLEHYTQAIQPGRLQGADRGLLAGGRLPHLQGDARPPERAAIGGDHVGVEQDDDALPGAATTPTRISART